LREQVNVGIFSLLEQMPIKEGKTGQGLSYVFAIQGQGNIAAIKEPIQAKTGDSLAIFTSNTQQQINKGEGVVYGAKQFEYYIEPQEPGQYNTGRYFQWIYFNVKEGKYDTLKANTAFTAEGGSIKNLSVDTDDLTGIYAGIYTADTDIAAFGDFPWRWIGNIALLLLTASAVWIAWRR
jgi:hypothetical protein